MAVWQAPCLVSGDHDVQGSCVPATPKLKDQPCCPKEESDSPSHVLEAMTCVRIPNSDSWRIAPGREGNSSVMVAYSFEM